ncbi:MAG: protein phosphatase 2C domain-containing protein, partial [Muribaculaceae bacterium]|nr:protein phosphatase 2C domain-containing protein [Muribaculaceae bacterium]
MDKKQRRATRRNQTACRLNESARALDKALLKAGVSAADKESFLNWAIGSLWNSFNEERMNQRIMIENEVRRLGLRFPNGTVKKEYSVFFNLPVDKISDIELVGAEELGLMLAVGSDGKCSLSGSPRMAGDYSLKLRFKTVEGEPVSEIAIPVAFNPNPRDLWRNIPTDTDIPYYKPDSATGYVKVEAGADGMPKKDIVAASQRGRSHAQEGKARDDHFSLFHCDESDWYIIAVADGAGSAKYSRKGSEVACKTVIDHCKSLLLDNPEFEASIREYEADRENQGKRTDVTRHVIDIIYKGAMKAHEAVRKVAEANEEARLKDFATTLMFAVCKKYDFGWFIASFWVGDGAMCLFDADNKTAKLLGTPDEGEFSGQTRFLTMPEIFRDPDVVSKRLRMAIVPDFTALFLMSDGVSDPMFET